MRRVIFATAVMLLAAGPARADVVILHDGRIIDGPKMERVGTGVKVHFENGDVVIPSRLVETAILEGDAGFVPRTPEEKEKAAQGLVRYEGKWMKPQKRRQLVAKRLAQKRAYLEEIRGHQEWRNRWKKKTKHFLFEYTVPPHIADYYAGLMDAYFREFGKIWRITKPKGYYPLKVCFYTSYEKFLQISGAGYGVQGYFKFVKPLELNFYYNRLDPRYTEKVLFHEVNHYLQMLINVDFSMPHFPGESLAEYYGASVYDARRKKLTVGLIQEGRLSTVKTDIAAGKRWELEKLVSAPRGTYAHYNWGWTLVHFLMTEKKYRKKFESFVMALANGRDVRRVPMGFGNLKTVEGPEVWKTFRKYLGLRNDAAVRKLQKAWYDYIDRKLQITSARGLEQAAFDAARTGRPIRAKRLYQEAIDKGTDNPLTYHRFADLVLRDGDRKKAIALWKKAIELDPLTAEFYASLGEALHDDDATREEGKRLLKLALELDPDDIWLAFRVKQVLTGDK